MIGATLTHDLNSLFAAYKIARSNNTPARFALSCIRYKTLFNPHPVPLEDGARFEHEGFTMRVRVEIDSYTDISWLGEFSNKRGVDAIAHERWNRRTYNWFNPMITVAEHRAELSNLGYSRNNAEMLARDYVRRNYREAVELNNIGTCSITITARLQSIELGEASLSGNSWDDIQSTILENDLIPEALHDAKENLTRLCWCRGSNL